MDDIQYDEDDAILCGHVAQLLEHFESVRVFVTRSVRGDDGPASLGGSQGGGNFYAQIGQVREWLVQQDHRARMRIEQVDAEAECDEDD